MITYVTQNFSSPFVTVIQIQKHLRFYVLSANLLLVVRLLSLMKLRYLPSRGHVSERTQPTSRSNPTDNWTCFQSYESSHESRSHPDFCPWFALTHQAKSFSRKQIQSSQTQTSAIAPADHWFPMAWRSPALVITCPSRRTLLPCPCSSSNMTATRDLSSRTSSPSHPPALRHRHSSRCQQVLRLQVLHLQEKTQGRTFFSWQHLEMSAKDLPCSRRQESASCSRLYTYLFSCAFAAGFPVSRS